MKRFNSAKRLGFQLLLVISSGLVFLASYFIISDYNKTIELSREDAMEQLETVAKTISLNLDGNQHDYLMQAFNSKDAIKRSDENEIYLYIHRYLRKVQLANGIETDIYTLFYDSTQLDKNSTPFYFGITSGEVPYFRHPYINYPAELEKNYKTGGRIPVYTDEHGSWLSYIAPIRDKNKKVVAVVQVDKQFDEFIASSRKQAIKGVWISLLIFFLIGSLLVFIVRKIVMIDELKSIRLERMHERVTMQHKDITDSINYSERIQKAIVPNSEAIQNLLPNSFLFYKAKDVISGDFPWIHDCSGGYVYIAAVDCTGHGVPGSMLSFIGYFLLNGIIRRRSSPEPAHILDELCEDVIITLKQEKKKHPWMVWM